MDRCAQPFKRRSVDVLEDAAQQLTRLPPFVALEPKKDRRLVREGDALKTLRVDLPETIDLALLDGHKALYSNILKLLESRLRPGTLIVADNADHSPDYLAHVRSPANGYLSTPFTEDVELSMRIV
jgi:predicted O-methyltransferase YrrM